MAMMVWGWATWGPMNLGFTRCQPWFASLYLHKSLRMPPSPLVQLSCFLCWGGSTRSIGSRLPYSLLCTMPASTLVLADGHGGGHTIARVSYGSSPRNNPTISTTATHIKGAYMLHRSYSNSLSPSSSS